MGSVAKVADGLPAIQQPGDHVIIDDTLPQTGKHSWRATIILWGSLASRHVSAGRCRLQPRSRLLWPIGCIAKDWVDETAVGQGWRAADISFKTKPESARADTMGVRGRLAARSACGRRLWQ